MGKSLSSAALILSAALLLAGVSAQAQTVFFVKADAAGANNGSSWTDAFTLLESALQAAIPGDEIWVASGTYYPTNDYGLAIGDRGKHFRLKSGVAVYGGFKGTEDARGKRDPAANVATLSGDIGTSGNNSDNCYHVFYHPASLGLGQTAVLDGVTISGGNAGSASSPHNRGGGMYNEDCSPRLINCLFSGNHATEDGGAIYNNSCAPELEDCVFTANTAYGNGGAMFNSSSPVKVTDSLFDSNSATGSGGAAANDSGSPVFKNCVFTGNAADLYGGGIYFVSGGSATLTNSVFSGNEASAAGGALRCSGASPALRNCILWGNSAPAGAEVSNFNAAAPSFRYCDVLGSGGSGAWAAAIGADAGGNIDADPLFIAAGSQNYHLQRGSPCIDAADGDLAPDRDMEGRARVDDPETANTGAGAPNYADIGAFEYQFMQVIFPSDSGIRLEVGKKVVVTWVSSLPANVKLKVELVKGGAETWLLSPGAVKGQFKWTVGKWKSKTQAVYADGTDYKIRISTLDGNYWDESDNDFSIGRVTSVTVSGPADVTGGVPAQYTCTAHYNIGDDRDVTNEAKWSAAKIKGVKIKMNKKTGLLITPVVPSDLPCSVAATYGKGKPPIGDTLGITIHEP